MECWPQPLSTSLLHLTVNYCGQDSPEPCKLPNPSYFRVVSSYGRSHFPTYAHLRSRGKEPPDALQPFPPNKLTSPSWKQEEALSINQKQTMFFTLYWIKSVTICFPYCVAPLWIYASLILTAVTTDHILPSMCDHFKWLCKLRLVGRGILKTYLL